MKLYTKTGDGGTTALIGGERVSKADPRVEAYGTVDELSAHLAMLGDLIAAGPETDAIVGQIAEIQRDLMVVMASMAGGAGGAGGEEAIERLEKWIDAMDAPFTGFVTPGGDVRNSQAHICRTVCRRAERRAVAASCDPRSVSYLNRLSDWCFAVSKKNR